MCLLLLPAFSSHYLLCQSYPDDPVACALSLSHQGASVAQGRAPGSVFFAFILKPPAPVKLSQPASSPSSPAPAPLSAPHSWRPQAHLDSQPASSLHEGQGEVPGALDVAPQSLHLASPGNHRDLGQQLCHDVSTLTGEEKKLQPAQVLQRLFL